MLRKRGRSATLTSLLLAGWAPQSRKKGKDILPFSSPSKGKGGWRTVLSSLFPHSIHHTMHVKKELGGGKESYFHPNGNQKWRRGRERESFAHRHCGDKERNVLFSPFKSITNTLCRRKKGGMFRRNYRIFPSNSCPRRPRAQAGKEEGSHSL